LESKDKIEQEKGRRNAQWVMAATSGTRVSLKTVTDARTQFKNYFEQKMREQKVTGPTALY